ncbi:MAG TPA: NifU family protein [Patescibacteria group bacterium]|nr:NifU family protein [Patescibacteria group bacterium]
MTTPEPQRLDIIAATIQAARPALQQDGGDIELIAVEGDRIKVKLSGACVSCSMAAHTLGGVRRQLMEVLGEPVRVIPAN